VGRAKKSVKADSTHVVAYLRVSSQEQADSGLGLAAQRATIEAEAARRGWNIVAWHEDAGLSGKTLARAGLTAALADVEEHRAAAIVAAKLDRLSRSLLDFAALMDRARRGGWGLVALDLQVDTTTPGGEMMANVLAVFAQYERRLIGQRTRDALAALKADGASLGRPTGLPAEVLDRIVADHAAGAGWSELARALNAEGVPTAQGGARWHPSTVRYVCLAATERAAAR